VVEFPPVAATVPLSSSSIFRVTTPATTKIKVTNSSGNTAGKTLITTKPVIGFRDLDFAKAERAERAERVEHVTRIPRKGRVARTA
jgi:hypothetical protein